MLAFWVGLGSALWLGILTSISPCPLATNITAISYIGKRVERPRLVLISGLLYTVGRMVAYVVVAALVIAGLSSIPIVANFLQQNMNRLLGPILILAGLLLLDVLPISFGSSGVSEQMQQRADRWGVWGALLLGVLFALAFCPVSAALFFGSLIPLALQHQFSLLLPLVYGIGTALPVVAFSLLLAFATQRLSRAFNLLTTIERWMRRLTALIFLAVGAYYTLMFTLHWL